MRIVRYVSGGRPAVGIQLDGGVRPTKYADLRELITAGPDALDRLQEKTGDRARLIQPDRLLAPVATRCQLLFPGGNYRNHLAEVGLAATEPVFFAKLWSSVIGPGDPIAIPTPQTHTDWEGELAFVVSRQAHKVPAERAYDYIFGFTMVNDVTARDVMDDQRLQITLSKSPDTFCPIGPYIVTADELPEVNAVPLELSTRVNGVIKQQATTDTMIHTIPALLEFLTRTVTLQPGDVVSSGTPGGTGAGRTPPEFLRPGDEVSVGIPEIGYLTNPIVAGWNGLAADEIQLRRTHPTRRSAHV